NARANRLARYLRRQGVIGDARVCVYAERGVEMVVGWLAVLKAGGAYVPLDTSYPRERVEYMLRGSAPVVVLTQRHLQELVADSAAAVVALEDEALGVESEENLSVEVGDAGHLAYVIYTSGSTGQPKGVMVEQRSLANLVSWHCEQFGVR